MKTLKTLAIFCLSAMLVSCAAPEASDGGNTGSDDGNTINEKGVSLVVDKLFIYNNGGADENGVATFTVYYNGEDVTNDENTAIFQDKNLLVGNTFTSTADPCSLRFRAAYGADYCDDEILLNIVQTPPTHEDTFVDNNREKTDFVRRVLITQFTGTNCGFCPEMVNALHTVASSQVYSSKFVLAAAHLYNGTDPAYLNDAKTLHTSVGVNSFPTINADMWQNNANRNSDSVGALIRSALSRTTVKGGIAASACHHEDKNYVTVCCHVKAKESGNFRVGAWLLEDEIWGQQANNGYTAVDGVKFNYHNNCIRIANQSRQSSIDYTGLTLGYIEAGQTATKEFAFPLQTSWNTEKLHLVLFISTQEGNNWYVNNVITAPINGEVDFDYITK